MNRETMTKAIIESVVQSFLKEMKRDPDRALRKLVDMGEQFAKGMFQSRLFALTQHMLQNEESVYYVLMRRLVDQTCLETLKTFGVNLGYLGCVRGAERIREKEAACAFHIPWAILVHLEEGQVFPLDEYDRMIQEGKADGVVTYLFDCQNPSALSFLIQLIQKEGDCAFGLSLSPSQVTEQLALQLEPLRNVLIILDTQQADFASAAERLRRHGCLYAGRREYWTPEDEQAICSGAWAALAADAGCALAFAYAGASCPDEICRRVQAALEGQRNEPTAPVILMNFYTDYLQVDQAISGETGFMGVLPDGRVTSCDGFREMPSELNLLGQPLDHVLAALNGQGKQDVTV